jgi:NTE family protein
MIENLAIKGGGVKGVAYVGALYELEKANLYHPLKRIAGTSTGSLLATMISVGYSVPQIEELMLSIQFKQFLKGWNPIRIFNKYGLYSGDYLLSFAKSVLNKSPLGLTEDATFDDLYNAGGKDLFTFSCNTTMHDVSEFSRYKTPKVKIAEAVRASMSIPFFFKAWKFKDNNPDDHIYVDGGIIYNYPLSLFDDARFNTDANVNFKSIGLYLYTKNKHKAILLNYKTPIFFAKELFESLIETQDYIILKDREQVQRSILIDDLQIPATDFNITTKQLKDLMASGRAGAKEFIDQLTVKN